MLVYLIVNTVNGKCYVGQTIHALDKRWHQHCMLQGKCRVLENAIRKYGIKAFEISVVATVKTQEELNRLEKLTCEALNAYAPHGYNLREGGGAKGKMHEETKRIIRGLALEQKRLAAFKAMASSPEAQAKMQIARKKNGPRSAALMAAGRTPEVEALRRQASAKTWANPEVRKAQSERQREIQARPEVKAKKAASLAANWASMTEEDRAARGNAISAGTTGVKKTVDNSPEAKAARSAARLKAWEKPEMRAKHAESMAAHLADPEFLKKRGAAIGAALAAKREADPEFFSRRAEKHAATRAAIAAAKTHCKNGHELTEENVYLASGKKRCLTCRRDAVARFNAKKGAEVT